jgi:hypothetical protein
MILVVFRSTCLCFREEVMFSSLRRKVCDKEAWGIAGTWGRVPKMRGKYLRGDTGIAGEVLS